MRSSIIFLLTTQSHNVISFTPNQYKTFHSSGEFTTLEAKSKKNKQKKTSTASGGGSTGGFGKTTTFKEKKKLSNTQTKENSDYSTFPALEDGVKKTLVPSPKEAKEIAQDLSNEMYDRLAQVYGFRDFNFPDASWFDDDNGDAKEIESPISLQDLLMTGRGGNDTKSSDFGDLLKPKTNEFSDLISSVADSSTPGGTAESKLNAPTSSSVAAVPSSKYLGIETLPPFNKFRVLHVDPMVLAIDDFFTEDECDAYINRSSSSSSSNRDEDNTTVPMMSRSKTVGKDSLAQAQRTSTTWFHHFKNVPGLMAKASRLLGLRNIDKWEEPQTVRYRQTEKFTWHLDALAPSESVDAGGGQRVATLLVYLNTVSVGGGGATVFRDLGGEDDGVEKYLKVQPKKGSALLFFPSAGGIPNSPFDIRTLHAGEAMASDAGTDKWIAQLWLRENDGYEPSGPPGNTHALADDAIKEYCSRIS